MLVPMQRLQEEVEGHKAIASKLRGLGADLAATIEQRDNFIDDLEVLPGR